MPRGRALLLAVVLLAAVPAGGSHGEFEASFEHDHVVTGSETTLHTTADAGTSVEITVDGLAPETLSEMVAGSVETADGVRTTVGENGSVTVAVPRDFRCEPYEYLGGYTFRVRNRATNATATASINVTAPAAGRASFEGAVFHVQPGNDATIRFDGCDRGVTLVVGDGDHPFAGNVTMNPSKESWGVEFDTSRVATGNATEVFRPGENSTIADATIDRRPDDEPLPVGEYPMTLYTDGDEVDAAVLNVTTDTPTPSPTPTVTASPTATESPTPAGTEATTDFPTATPTTEPPTETRSPTDALHTPTSSPPDGVGQPGFELGAALVAGAAAAALLAVRR